MNPHRIDIMRRDLARLKDERADRVRRGAKVPEWFDHMIQKREEQLIASLRSVPINPPAPKRGLLARIFGWAR